MAHVAIRWIELKCALIREWVTMIGLVRTMNLFVLFCPYTHLSAGFSGASWEEDYESRGKFSHSYFRGCCHSTSIYLRSGEPFPDIVGGAAFIVLYL
jgi:hypothetical protein